MLGLKTPKEMSQDAHNLARGSAFVRYRNITYAPVDYHDGEFDPSVVPDPMQTIWIPLNREEIRQLAASQFDALFQTKGQLDSFDFMVAQNAYQVTKTVPSLLIKTKDGLKLLNDKGELEDPSGEFVPNVIQHELNTSATDKKRVFSVIKEWVDSEEEAVSLLSHLATILSPGWSAVKYVLLLGEGRNGKSVMLKMLQALLGIQNVSHVTRQQISEQSPVVTELNGKLANIIFDGRAEYLKDSGTEKSLVAGEMAPIRMLYDSAPTMVQTNALFIEGLNREPKSNDKSTALQKRLVRFQFPNVYDLNHAFEREMMSAKSLGAFLSLLVDHYVQEDEVAVRLAPTAKAIELQLEHMFVNSLALQFFKYLEETEKEGAASLLGQPLIQVTALFRSWRVRENDLGTWSEPDVFNQFAALVNTDRKSVRVGGVPRKTRVISSFKDEALAYIESVKGDVNDEAALVGE